MQIVRWSIVLAIMGFLVGGCGMTSQERIDLARNTLPMAQDALNKATVELTEVRDKIAVAEAQLADPNMANSPTAIKIREYLAQLQERLTSLLDKKAQAEQVITMLERTIAAGPQADAQLGDEMVMLGQALLGGTAFVSGDAKVWMYIVGTVLTVIGGMLVKKTKTLGTALAEIVAGGEKFKAEVTKLQEVPGTSTMDLTMAKELMVEVFRAAHFKTQKHEATRLLVEKTQKAVAA